MIIFGLRASNIGTFETGEIKCDYCNTKGSQQFSVYGKYFHVFWIPIFPISKKEFSECTHCKRTLGKKEFSPELKRLYVENKNKIKRPFWHWSGTILIGLLVLSNVLIGKTSKKTTTSKEHVFENKVLDANKIKNAILQSSSDSPIIIIAKSIMEVNNVNQVISLKDKLALYEKNPNSVFKNGEYLYDTQNRKNEVSRGLADDYPKDTKWLLMIDNLSNADYLWEFDNSDGHDSMISALEVLAKKKKYTLPEIPREDNDNLTVAETLTIFNKTLNNYGLTLIELFIDSDSHVTGLIKKENFTELNQNAKSAGYMVFEY